MDRVLQSFHERLEVPDSLLQALQVALILGRR